MRSSGSLNPKWSDDELIDFMLDHSDPDQPADRGDAEGTRLCRPSEACWTCSTMRRIRS